MRRTALLLLFCSLAVGVLPAAAQTAYSVQSDGDDKLYSIDLATGEATEIGPTGFQDVESLTFAPGCDTLYGVDDVVDKLVTCNVQTGHCTEVGRLGVDITDTGLAVASNGQYYVSTDVPVPENLYRTDPRAGTATRVGAQRFHITGLAARLPSPDPSEKCRSGIFGLEGDTRRGVSSKLLCVSEANGTATPIGPLGLTITDGGLDFSADGILYGITDGNAAGDEPSRIFTVNPDTGAATVVAAVTVGGRPVSGFEGLAVADGVCTEILPQSVLEVPALDTWGAAGLFLLLSAAGFAALRRRRDA